MRSRTLARAGCRASGGELDRPAELEAQPAHPRLGAGALEDEVGAMVEQRCISRFWRRPAAPPAGRARAALRRHCRGVDGVALTNIRADVPTRDITFRGTRRTRSPDRSKAASRWRERVRRQSSIVHSRSTYKPSAKANRRWACLGSSRCAF
jgi:hypothetical protein